MSLSNETLAPNNYYDDAGGFDAYYRQITMTNERAASIARWSIAQLSDTPEGSDATATNTPNQLRIKTSHPRSMITQNGEPRYPTAEVFFAETLTPITMAQANYCRWWRTRLNLYEHGPLRPRLIRPATEARFSIHLYEQLAECVPASSANAANTVFEPEHIADNIDDYYRRFPIGTALSPTEETARAAMQYEMALWATKYFDTSAELQALSAVIRNLRLHRYEPAVRAAYVVLTAYGMAAEAAST